MKPSHHVVISAAVTSLFALWVRSWPALAACFLSGILIDIDHHLDYWFNEKKFPFRYRDLVEFCSIENKNRGKLYLIFHSYELLFLFWWAVLYLQLGVIWLGMAIGLTVHMLFDQLFNPLKRFAYFLTYRILVGFKRENLFDPSRYQKVF